MRALAAGKKETRSATDFQRKEPGEPGFFARVVEKRIRARVLRGSGEIQMSAIGRTAKKAATR
jgi:hypothetical protein